MELYLQMGHGMQQLCLDLFSEWKHGTVVLSPMNIAPNRIAAYSARVKKAGGNILFDPQLYYPRKYQKKLLLYPYWPQEGITLLENGAFDTVIDSLLQINDDLGTAFILLPSFTTAKVDSIWNKLQTSIIMAARQKDHQAKLYQTIALSNQVMIDENQIEEIVSFAEGWNADGFYIVCEHPSNEYLVSNALWVSNQLALVAGLKRLGKKVIVGYSNHQQLCLAAAKCDAIASGTFRNVRWFQPEHFETVESDEASQRARWYYCPQALTEFKITFLDIAQRMSLLSMMSTAGSMQNSYSEMLFAGAIPSSTGYRESDSFKHYLWCLNEQCNIATRSTYKETLDAQLMMLDTAEQILTSLHDKRIKGQDRDFLDIVSINQAALSAHDMAYQYSLSQEWNML